MLHLLRNPVVRPLFFGAKRYAELNVEKGTCEEAYEGYENVAEKTFKYVFYEIDVELWKSA